MLVTGISQPVFAISHWYVYLLCWLYFCRVSLNCMGLVGFTNLNNSNYSSKKCNMAYIVLVKYFPEDLDVLQSREGISASFPLRRRWQENWIIYFILFLKLLTFQRVFTWAFRPFWSSLLYCNYVTKLDIVLELWSCDNSWLANMAYLYVRLSVDPINVYPHWHLTPSQLVL